MELDSYSKLKCQAHDLQRAAQDYQLLVKSQILVSYTHGVSGDREESKPAIRAAATGDTLQRTDNKIISAFLFGNIVLGILGVI